jgi:hypothetical protein
MPAYFYELRHFEVEKRVKMTRFWSFLKNRAVFSAKERVFAAKDFVIAINRGLSVYADFVIKSSRRGAELAEKAA